MLQECDEVQNNCTLLLQNNTFRWFYSLIFCFYYKNDEFRR